MTLETRFWQSVEIHSEHECWPWQLAIRKKDGYGVVGVDGRQRYAHRVAYELARGPIPDGLTVDHLCRNRACVNPNHLEAVTMRENILRGRGWAALNAAKTHCGRGHEFTPENTFLDRAGARQCRVCRRIRGARYDAIRRKAA